MYYCVSLLVVEVKHDMEIYLASFSCMNESPHQARCTFTHGPTRPQSNKKEASLNKARGICLLFTEKQKRKQV